MTFSITGVLPAFEISNLHRAQHEAGHALMASLMGFGIEYVDLSRLYLGEYTCHNREEQIQLMMILAAGVAATKVCRPHVSLEKIWAQGGGGDWRALEPYLHEPGDHGPLVRKAVKILKKHRATLDTLIEMLLLKGKLLGEEVERIVPGTEEFSIRIR